MNLKPIDNQGGILAGVLTFFVLCTIATAGIYYAGHHYFVNTRDGIKIYPKKEFNLTRIYVDMATMPFSELRNHKDLVKTMAAHKDLEYLPGGESLEVVANAGKSVTDAVKNFDSEQTLKDWIEASKKKLKKIDQDYKVTDSIKEAARVSKEKMNELNEKYKIDEKVDTAGQKVKEKAEKLNDWLKEKK